MIVDRRFRGAYCLHHPWWWRQHAPSQKTTLNIISPPWELEISHNYSIVTLHNRQYHRLKIAVFWDVAPCSLSDIDRRFSTNTLTKESVSSSQTLVSIYHSTRCYIPPDSHLQTRQRNIRAQLDPVPQRFNYEEKCLPVLYYRQTTQE
jgi:hypothetical protein